MRRKLWQYAFGLGVLCALSHYAKADTIWEENFSYATGTTFTDQWSTANENVSGYFEVNTIYSNGLFEGESLIEEAIWTSESIDISNFNSVSFSIFLHGSSTLESSDYISVFYITDTGPEIMATTLSGGFSEFSFNQPITGNTLTIIVKVKNGGANDYHRFDDIQVTGTPVHQLLITSFEASGDTWNYSAFPNQYNTENDTRVLGATEDVWAIIEEFTNHIETPAHEDYFWAMHDLDNNQGGGSFYHYLDFEPVDISDYNNVGLSFQYYADGLNNGDEMSYSVRYDNGKIWDSFTTLGTQSNGWVQVEINAIPPEVGIIRLRLRAKLNGSEGYGGWDDIRLSGEEVAITHFYSTATSNLTDTNNWKDAENNSPPDFFTDQQVFHLQTGEEITLDGNWTIAGNRSKLKIENNTHLIIPATYFLSGKTDVTNGATLTLENEASPTLGILSPLSTVVYARSTGLTNQVIPENSVFGNLVLKNSAPSKEFSGEITVAGNLLLNNTKLSASAVTDLHLSGNLTLTGDITYNASFLNRVDLITEGNNLQTFSATAATADIRFRNLESVKWAGGIQLEPTSNLLLEKDLILEYYRNASFSDNDNMLVINRNFEIKGEVNQKVHGGTYAAIKLNGSANGMLMGDATITNELALTSGNLVLGNHNVWLQSGAAINGGNANSYLITGEAGVLIQYIPNTGSEIIFPVGTAGNYTPCSISNAPEGNNDFFMVRVIDGVYQQGTTGEMVEGIETLVKKTWEINPENHAGAVATLHFFWNTSDTGENFDADRVRVIKYHSSWESITEEEVPGQVNGLYTTTVPQIVEFSSFTIGGENATLPITLLSFQGRVVEHNAVLTWTTEEEVNNMGFEIQKSPDGKIFYPIGFIKSKSKPFPHYSFTDVKIMESAYYRLKQFDFDGSISLSKSIFLSYMPDHNPVVIFPNPARQKLFLEIKNTGNTTNNQNQICFSIENARGQIVFTTTGSINQVNAQLNEVVPKMKRGIYFVNILYNQQPNYFKLIKN